MAVTIGPEDLDAEARKVMQYMVQHVVYDHRVVTYGDICGNVLKNGNDGLAARFVLGRIEKFCVERAWPRLNVGCVNKKTGRPGKWAYDSSHEDRWQRQMREIHTFNWRRITIIPPEE